MSIWLSLIGIGLRVLIAIIIEVVAKRGNATAADVQIVLIERYPRRSKWVGLDRIERTMSNLSRRGVLQPSTVPGLGFNRSAISFSPGPSFVDELQSYGYTMHDKGQGNA